MTHAQQYWIDHASYAQLLSRWRYARVGDSMFVGEAGAYYARTMAARRNEVGPSRASAISRMLADARR